MKHLILGLALSLCAAVGSAQNGPIASPQPGVIDGVVMQQHIPTKKVIAYPHLREADYIWSRRVWRTIDLREKANYGLYYPLVRMSDRWSLYHILESAILSGDVTAYLPFDKQKFIISNGTQGNDGDQFKYPVLPTGAGASSDSLYRLQIKELFNAVEDVDSVPPPLSVDNFGNPIYNPQDVDQFGNPIIYKTQSYTAYEGQDVVEYHIKEEWFFDKQRSVMDVRILGIAPVKNIKENGQIVGKREMFWVYFPEARYVLQNFFMYNEKNDARRMSFDDFFWKRKFQSYIDKETNVYDRDINDHKVGVDALLKSEEIKKDIFEFEHDLWHF